MRWVYLLAFLLPVACTPDKLLHLLGTPPIETPPTRSRSSDDRLEIMLPSGWQVTDLPEAVGTLQAKSVRKGAFVSLISEPKEDLNFKTIDEYAETILTIEGKQRTIQARTISPAKRLNLNGRSAIQYEVRGILDNIKIVYLKTFVESESRWTQVMAWTSPSHWNEVQDDFRVLNQSFHELPAQTKK